MESTSVTPKARIGRYDVIGLLATGGMAEILLARLEGPSGFERPVVLKRILPHLARQSAFVDMFIDEARIAAAIRHPNVAQVSELGRDGTELFLVLEYLEGESLGGVMRRLAASGERLPPALCAWIVAEACAGLHAAHEMRDDDGYPRDLVHRDVSPQNVFVTYTGQVKLLDFGIAKAADRMTVTETGHVKGKFAYMSPEQCLGNALDRRSDVFAMGILLFEMCTGRRLFQRATQHLTFRAICDEPITPPSEVDPDCPELLSRICMRALSRDREQRPATAAELRRELLAASRALGAADMPDEELGRTMQRMFSERIEEKQDMLRRFRSGITPAHVPAAETDLRIELPSVVDEPSIVRTTRDIRPVNARRPSRRWIGAAVTLLMLGGVYAGVRRADQPTSPAPSSQPTVASPPLPPSVSAPSVAERPTIRLDLQTTPSGAEVWVDGRSRGTSPLKLELERATTPLQIEFRRAGYETLRQRVVPDVDQRLIVPLRAAARARPKPPPEMPRFR